ncbi:endonuclease/exonuclease/phosphatase family protein [Leucobacter albus]|uniref:Endonuclease/exonuclease/phosphatase family protein n=1 Tax=Leucobacter albus TaxID=272210 RepID=A0ABW3TMW4_9MICO
MKTISYNLRKNRAIGELATLVDIHDAELLCLQEADTLNLPSRIGSLSLVRATERNRLGLAMYVNSERFEVRSADAFQLKKSLHDRLLAPAHERLLAARIHDRETASDFVAASFHAAPLTARNSLRRIQISAAIDELAAIGPGLPSIMVGDYNYPVFHNRLTAHVRASGYDTNFSDKRTYNRYLLFRGHYDFVTSTGFEINRVQTLGRGSSDHLPIMVTAQRHEALVPLAA